MRAALERPLTFEQLVLALHPTPALGLAPRGSNIERLRSWCVPPDRRGTFGAPFGLRRSDGSELCVVAIRNVAWRGQELRLGSGCGIVSGSRPEREWAELEAKRASVRAMLCL